MSHPYISCFSAADRPLLAGSADARLGEFQPRIACAHAAVYEFCQGLERVQPSYTDVSYRSQVGDSEEEEGGCRCRCRSRRSERRQRDGLPGDEEGSDQLRGRKEIEIASGAAWCPLETMRLVLAKGVHGRGQRGVFGRAWAGQHICAFFFCFGCWRAEKSY